MEDQIIQVTGGGETPTHTTIRVRQFTMEVDEQPEFDGVDRGASPVESLMAALVGCLNVVAHLMAKEMGSGGKDAAGLVTR
jgi:uncharacterized OsmC-like protein